MLHVDVKKRNSQNNYIYGLFDVKIALYNLIFLFTMKDVADYKYVN